MGALVPLRRKGQADDRLTSFLPMTRDEMDARGWDQLDILIVNGDAYVDHPAFGGALIGRFLEAQGRSGVPLYLFYSKGGEAQMLPQVLTPGTLTALVTSP
jgi:hypothetical protein